MPLSTKFAPYAPALQAIGLAWVTNVVFTHREVLVKSACVLAGLYGSGYVAYRGYVYFQQRRSHTTQEEIEDDKDTQFERYTAFTKEGYEDLKEAYLKEEMRYTGKLEALKERECHLESDLPFDYTPTIKMFYDDKDEAFHYYTKTGNIPYNALNAVCRNYVLTFQCVDLYNDENEIDSYKKGTDFVHVGDEESEGEDKEEEEEEEEKRPSLFYFRPVKKDKDKVKKKEEKKVNKFIHKGNLLDYDSVFGVKNGDTQSEVKDIKYTEFYQVEDDDEDADETTLWSFTNSRNPMDFSISKLLSSFSTAIS